MVKPSKYILLVDDNKALTFLNKMTLSKLNLTDVILTAENGKEALKIITEHGIPECIFLDINMPIMNGWEFLVEYKAIEPSMSLSKIVITTGTQLDSQEEKMATTKYNITNFHNKTLTKENALNILSHNFCNTKQIEYIYN